MACRCRSCRERQWKCNTLACRGCQGVRPSDHRIVSLPIADEAAAGGSLHALMGYAGSLALCPAPLTCSTGRKSGTASEHSVARQPLASMLAGNAEVIERSCQAIRCAAALCSTEAAGVRCAGAHRRILSEEEHEQLLCVHEAHLGLRVKIEGKAQPAGGDIAAPWCGHLQGREVVCQLLTHFERLGWQWRVHTHKQAAAAGQAAHL